MLHPAARISLEIGLSVAGFVAADKLWDRYIGQSRFEKRLAALELRSSQQEVRLSDLENTVEINADATARIADALSMLDPQNQAA